MVRASFVALALMTTAAVASPLPLKVEGEVCGFTGLDARVHTIIGDAQPPPGISVRIETSSHDGQREARITFDDGNGSVRGPRIISADSCAELLESVAVVVAMGLEGPRETGWATSPASRTASAPPLKASRPTSPDGPSSADGEQQQDSGRASPVDVSLESVAAVVPISATMQSSQGSRETGFVVAAASGLTSEGLDGQLLLGARLRWGNRSVTGEARIDSPDTYKFGSMGAVGVLRAQATLSPCLHAGAFAGCGVLSVGMFHGAGNGLVEARSAFAPLFSTGVRLTWEHALTTRLTFRVHAEFDGVLTTTRFDVDNMTVWTSPRFEGSTGFGFLAHFP